VSALSDCEPGKRAKSSPSHRSDRNNHGRGETISDKTVAPTATHRAQADACGDAYSKPNQGRFLGRCWGNAVYDTPRNLDR